MTKVRSRGGARVDYTDFLSPAAKDLPSRGGGGGKRKAYDEETAEEEDTAEEEEELVAVKKKKPRKPANKPKKSVEEETEEAEEAKPKAKRAKKPTVVKRRTEAEEDEGTGERELQRAEKPESKSKKKTTKERDATSVVVSKARRYEEEEVVVRTSSSAAAPRGDASQEMAALRKKYDELREFRELETARLLQEAKALAKEEKRTYEKLVTKLKDEVATLLTRAQRVDANHKQRQEELIAEHQQRVDTLKRDRDDARETNERLRRRISELEADGGGRSTHAAGRTASITDAARAGELSVELSQAKKLLELYRLVTSTELRLIESMEEEDDEPDNCTDVACAVVDSVSGKRFVFDLAVPHDAREEVEYVPSDTPSRDFKTPTYLQEELSFKRSELTKFMRTALDVVIRKKKETTSKR